VRKADRLAHELRNSFQDYREFAAIRRRIPSESQAGLPNGSGIVRSASEEAHHSNHYYENDGEHHRIFSDVLAVIMPPQLVKKMS